MADVGAVVSLPLVEMVAAEEAGVAADAVAEPF